VWYKMGMSLGRNERHEGTPYNKDTLTRCINIFTVNMQHRSINKLIPKCTTSIEPLCIYNQKHSTQSFSNKPNLERKVPLMIINYTGLVFKLDINRQY